MLESVHRYPFQSTIFRIESAFFLDSPEKYAEYHIMDANEESTALGARLRSLRMQKGLSQRAFTKLIGINYTQYNRYENGETVPSAESLSKLAEALDVSVDYLLEGKKEAAATANLEDRELLALFEEVESFSEEEKAHIKAVIKAFVTQKKLQSIAS